MKKGTQYRIKEVGEEQVHNLRYDTIVTLLADYEEGDTSILVSGVHNAEGAGIITQAIILTELHDIDTDEQVFLPTFELGEIVKVVKSGFTSDVEVGKYYFAIGHGKDNPMGNQPHLVRLSSHMALRDMARGTSHSGWTEISCLERTDKKFRTQ